MGRDSNSGRDIHPAAIIAGLAALLVAFGMGAYTVGLNQPQEERYQAYRQPAEQPRQADPPGAAGPGPDALQYRTPCSQPEGRDESDLCAQWRAAKAAENSAFWTKWGFWIGVVGSSLLLWQIILTRQAVEDTSEATEAMREANRIQQTAIRPWIDLLPDTAEISHREVWWRDGKPVGSTIGAGDPSINATIKIKNVGKTPAYDIFWQSGRLRGQWQLVGEPDIHAPNDERFYGQVATQGGTRISALMPDESVTMRFVMSLDDASMSEDRPRAAPRYALFVTYRGDGINGQGQTGKVFMFRRADKERLDPAPGDNLDGIKVVLSTVDTARHLK